MMLRQFDERLLGFCANQSASFTPADWEKLDKEFGGQILRIVVLLLMGVIWYGHQDELKRIAHAWALNINNLPEMIHNERFDYCRFLAMLKKKL